MKNIKPMSLQQARKKAGISLQAMAKLLLVDDSNLSKYERGVNTPNLNMVLDYHILTNTKLENLFIDLLKKRRDVLFYQLKRSVEKLSTEESTRKVGALISQLQLFIQRLKPLIDVGKKQCE